MAVILREACPAPRQIDSNANGCDMAAAEGYSLSFGHVLLSRTARLDFGRVLLSRKRKKVCVRIITIIIKC